MIPQYILQKLDCFELKGRGPVFIVASPVENPRTIVGEVVEIDGCLLSIQAAESFNNVEIGDKISLLVWPVD